MQTDRNGEHEWARLPPPWAGEERVSQFTTLRTMRLTRRWSRQSAWPTDGCALQVGPSNSKDQHGDLNRLARRQLAVD